MQHIASHLYACGRINMYLHSTCSVWLSVSYLYRPSSLRLCVCLSVRLPVYLSVGAPFCRLFISITTVDVNFSIHNCLTIGTCVFIGDTDNRVSHRQTDRHRRTYIHTYIHTDRHTDIERQTGRQTHTYIHTYRQTHRHTDTDIHTYIQTDTQTHRQTQRDRHTDTDIHTYRQTHRQTDTDIYTYIQTDRQTDTDIQTDRHRQTFCRLFISITTVDANFSIHNCLTIGTCVFIRDTDNRVSHRQTDRQTQTYIHTN